MQHTAARLRIAIRTTSHTGAQIRSYAPVPDGVHISMELAAGAATQDRTDFTPIQ